MGESTPSGWEQLRGEGLAAGVAAREVDWLIEAGAGGTWPSVRHNDVERRTAQWFRSSIARRVAGEPFQYVLGSWAFRRLEVMVDSRVLIPRPETEELVDLALRQLEGLDFEPLVVDLGTGSGVIALAIAAEHQGARVIATDLSEDALKVAMANLSGMNRAATRVSLRHGSWWEALDPELMGSIDLLVSNPPYVSLDEMAQLPSEVADWEPHSALASGPDGLEDIATILRGACRWLRTGGSMVVEIGARQGPRVAAMAQEMGLSEVSIRTDVRGLDRFLVARNDGL